MKRLTLEMPTETGPSDRIKAVKDRLSAYESEFGMNRRLQLTSLTSGTFSAQILRKARACTAICYRDD